MAIFNISGGISSNLEVGTNKFEVYLEDDSGTTPSDTTGNVDFTDVQVGDTINLNLDAYGPEWDGTSYTKPVGGALNYFTEYEDPETGEPVEEIIATFILNSGQNTITLDYVEADAVSLSCTVTSVSVSGTTYTLGISFGAPTPTYATSFELDGYAAGDTLVVSIEEGMCDFPVIFSPSGSVPYSAVSATTGDSSIATASFEQDMEGNYFVIIGAESEGTTTLTVSMPTESGTPYTITYNVSVYQATPYAEDFDIDGVQSGGTINLTAGDGNVSYNYVYTPSGSTPWQTPQCTVADTSIANVNLSGVIDFAIQGFTAGTTTLTISYEPESGNIITKTYTVNVAPPVAENFSLDGYSYGDTISLQDTATSIAVEFSPEGSVPTSFTATSSDTAVATVAYANGAIMITPVADGTATLTAVLNGTDSETYTISVAFPPEPVPTNKVLGYEAVGFFKAKIEEASGGGGFTQLTEADYNATDADNQPCLYIGDLEPGVYFIGSESGWIYGININGYSRDRMSGTFIVDEWVANSSTDYHEKAIYWMSAQGYFSRWGYYSSNSQGWEFSSNSYYADESFVSTQLDQYVGQLYAQPTSSTYGNTGALYKFLTDNVDPVTGQWIGNTAEWWLCKGQVFDHSTGTSTYEWEKLADSAFTGTDGSSDGVAGLVPAPTSMETGCFLMSDGTWSIPQDTTYDDFIGTDGVNDGSQGLVPAPTATDVNKFLKGDGTWAAVGGGGASFTKALTTADYNDNIGGQQCVNLKKLDPGLYRIEDDTVKVYNPVNTTGIGYMGALTWSVSTLAIGCSFLIVTNCEDSVNSHKLFTTLYFGSPVSGENKIFSEVVSQWWGSAFVGEYVSGPQILQRTSAPTTSTTGVIGQLCVNTSNCNTYQCTAISGSGSGATYTWTQRW